MRYDASNAPVGESDAEGIRVADLVIVVLLAVLRVGTLALGLAEISGASGLLHPLAAMAALGVLAAQSILVFGFAAIQLARRASPVLGGRVALVETVAGVAGLFIVAYATPLALRATSTFWIEPYTVISAVILAAATRRAMVGAAGAVCLTAAYLFSVFVWAHGGMKLSSEAGATAWTNALSYLPFFAIGAIGFALLRSVVEQTDALRLLLGRLSAERARVSAAAEAYRIGHDIPKALLREVRRGTLETTKLRPWAKKYRDDLLKAIGHGTRQPVSLRDELDALARAFAAATTLRVDLDALQKVPTGAPTLLISEAVRELLNNASYHAFGFPATLTARSSAQNVQVAVHNDGPGVDPARLTSAWARKQNTLHQLEAAGGSYQVDSSPGSPAGTTVTVTWPAAVPAGRGKSAPGGS
jgi:signal transduction histidine kinase